MPKSSDTQFINCILTNLDNTFIEFDIYWNGQLDSNFLSLRTGGTVDLNLNATDLGLTSGFNHIKIDLKNTVSDVYCNDILKKSNTGIGTRITFRVASTDTELRFKNFLYYY